MTYQDVLQELQQWQAKVETAEFGSDAYHDAKQHHDQILDVLTWREWNFLRDHTKDEMTPLATAQIVAAVLDGEDPTPILNLTLNHQLSWNFLYHRRHQRRSLTDIVNAVPTFSESDLRKIEAGSVDLPSADWAQLFNALGVNMGLKFNPADHTPLST